jgi:hypothetical protein
MKKKRFTEEQIVGILRDAEASTIEKPFDSMESRNNRSLDGSASLASWRWRIGKNCASYDKKMSA